MSHPTILLGSWRRRFATALDPETDLETLNRSYVEAVRRAGGVPLIAPHAETHELRQLLALVDGVVITGGQDLDPATYGADVAGSRGVIRSTDDSDLALFAAAVDAGVPILGICRGIQVGNVALGGDLHQEVQTEGSIHHPTYAEMTDWIAHRHPVDVVVGSRLADIYTAGPLSVNSLHHQAIGRLADGLRVVATSPDGIIEAVEGDSSGIDLVAVQWHPELLDPADGGPLFDDLVARADSYAAGRVGAATVLR